MVFGFVLADAEHAPTVLGRTCIEAVCACWSWALYSEHKQQAVLKYYARTRQASELPTYIIMVHTVFG